MHFNKLKIALWIAGLGLICTDAAAEYLHPFRASDIDFAKCQSVRGTGVNESTEGVNNEGVEKCPLAGALDPVRLGKGDPVVIKWMLNSEDAKLECRALQLAAGGVRRGVVKSRGVVHCYGLISAKRSKRDLHGLVMEPLAGPPVLDTPKSRDFVLSSIARGLVSDALFALDNLYLKDLGCGDCEWAWVEDQKGLIASKLYDTGGPALQFGDDKAQKSRRQKCGQYKAVFEFLADLLYKIGDLKKAPNLVSEASGLLQLLGEFESDAVVGCQRIDTKVWPEEPECPDYCVVNQKEFEAWFMGEVSKAVNAGKKSSKSLSIIQSCLLDEDDSRCSILSVIVFSFLKEVRCTGGLRVSLAATTSAALKIALFQLASRKVESSHDKEEEARKESLQRRLENRKKKKGGN